MEIKLIKSSGQVAYISASNARTQQITLEERIKASHHDIPTAIIMAKWTFIHGLQALKDAKRAQRLGYKRLAQLVHRQGLAAFSTGKTLLLTIEANLLKCMQTETELLEDVFGVDVSSLFTAPTDAQLSLKTDYGNKMAAIVAEDG